MSTKTYEHIKIMSAPRYRVSTFLITINPNAVDKYESDDMKKVFIHWYRHYLKDSLIFRHDNPDDGWEKIDSAKIVQASVEVGGKYGKMHVHSVIRFQHNTNLTMNVPQMRKIFAKLFGMDEGKKCHVDSKFVRDNLAVAQSYVEKDGDVFISA